MGLETKLLQKMSQSLLMTPQLQQAIKLLQLGRLEYKEAIERELLENPALEEVRDESGPPAPPETAGGSSEPTMLSNPSSDGSSDGEGGEREFESEPKSDWEGYLDCFTDSRGSAPSRSTFDSDDRQPPEVVATVSESLETHLLEQVRLADMGEREKQIAQHIVGNLNSDGYLESSVEELASACGYEADAVRTVIDTLRFFDPPGVCSTNLQECLLTQLDARGSSDSLAARIVRNHLEKLEKRKIDQIARLEGVSVPDVAQAVAVLKTLDPRPGRKFAADTTRYIIPDVFVFKVGSEYVVTLNDEGLPRLRVSQEYLDIIKESAGENKGYLTERLRAAHWLIKSIHQRQQTIYRVTDSIMKFQREFLDHGIERLKPLVLKDVADDIGMHESTVSRVTTEKYVHTPQGIFELKFFFTSGIKTASGDISSSSVKERIKQLVGQESSDAPISDQQIVEMLAAEKINIARRTVAKYRESLGIPSSSQRKKMF
jgi:RNA polymerase sigma-54 factor